jgi:hypothetical protein
MQVACRLNGVFRKTAIIYSLVQDIKYVTGQIEWHEILTRSNFHSLGILEDIIVFHDEGLLVWGLSQQEPSEG